MAFRAWRRKDTQEVDMRKVSEATLNRFIIIYTSVAIPPAAEYWSRDSFCAAVTASIYVGGNMESKNGT